MTRLRLPSLATIVLIGLALRLLFVLVLPQQPFSDGAWYVDRARGLVAGLGYKENGVATAFWPAGYPVLLGAVATLLPMKLAILLINFAAATATMLLIARLGTSVVGSGRAGRIGTLIYALYPAHIAYTGAPLAEGVSTALVLGGFALLIERTRIAGAVAAGLLFGLATTMRAQILYFPAGIIVALAILPRVPSWRPALTAGLIAYLAMGVAVAPLTLRNCHALGTCVLVSTNGGVALRTGASDDATGDHLDWNRARWDKEGIPFDARVARQVEADAHFRRSAIDWISANPARWVALMPVKAVMLWTKDSDGFWFVKGSYPKLERPLTLVQFANQGYYFAILLLALPSLWVGLVGLWRRDPARRQLLLLFLMPAFVTLTAIVFTGQQRYHYPAMPFLVLAAAATLARMHDKRGARR